MEKRALVWAGNLLMGIAGWQFAGLAWFCWAGGIEGLVSPVAAFAVVWPIAALLGYVGWRLRSTPPTPPLIHPFAKRKIAPPKPSPVLDFRTPSRV